MTNNKIKKLFKGIIDEEYIKKLQYDDVSLYSITDHKISEKIAKILIKLSYINNLSTITDMTACIGGDTINFSKYFRNIISIEIDKNRYKMLYNNVNTILKLDNIKTYCGDSLKIIKETKQDIIYLDPPWGGPTYKKKENVSLFMNETNIKYLINTLLNYAIYVAIKVPNNYNIIELEEYLNKINRYITIEEYELIKFKLLLIYIKFNG